MGETKLQIEQAVEAGTKFCNLFYETYDKSRHKIGKMYHDSAKLVWEGNGVDGNANIQKYLQDLPGCFHHTDWFDSQPVLSQFTSGKETIMVAAGGTVKYDGHPLKAFTQNFTLTNVDGTWKIVSDNLRLRVP
uniref:NTF2-related export protein n=1 Tax=Phallusia mammillata TaxID=59560 RepID=A0A6F9DNF4_9ASCI|nr:NTF2-related export protein-like [Phallusia mammillata]